MVALWLIVVPMTLMDLLDRMQDTSDPLSQMPLRAYLTTVDPQGILFVLAFFTLIIVSFWGTACILFVGQRMIQNRAGRSRTSFKVVRTEARPLLIPLILTSLLRACIAVEWSLLFFVPFAILLVADRSACPGMLNFFLQLLSGNGQEAQNTLATVIETGETCAWAFLLLPLLLPAAIYLIRTSLFHAAIATEDLRYRQALRRSRDVMKGRFWTATGYLLAICVVIFVPALLLDTAVHSMIESLDSRLSVSADILSNGVFALAEILFILSTIELFGMLRKHPILRLKK